MPENLLSPSSGMPKSLLDQINVDPSHVITGITFLNRDGELQTGTLSLSGNATASQVLSGRTFYSNSFTRQTGSLNIADEIMDLLESYQIAYISRYAGDVVHFGGNERYAKRNSSAKALYIWMNEKDSYYYGWFVCSLTNGGHTLTAQGKYSDSTASSISTSYGTLYYSYMNQRANHRYDNYVTINGTNKTLRAEIMISVDNDSGTHLQSKVANFCAYLLKNTHN